MTKTSGWIRAVQERIHPEVSVFAIRTAGFVPGSARDRRGVRLPASRPPQAHLNG